MKILEINFKNLNSLRGEWHIDLTHNAYASNGIFAITGPTGAGKTTIFDAICLALYGRTSRLKNVSQSTNEIMSIGEAECYAQVIFSTDAGVFKSTWGQHRAGNKSTGKLQSPIHKLDGDKPLTSLKGTTAQEITRITGMDFKRFTRAMMLEQGGFDAFLKADKNDRAEILELITGTNIYSEISRLVYVRKKEESDKLTKIEIQLKENLSRDTAGSVEEINAELESQRAQKKLLEISQTETSKARDWLKEIRKLNNELSQIDSEIDNHKIRTERFEADRKILDAAERAESLRADYTALILARNSSAETKKNLENIERELSSHEENFSGLTEKIIPSLKKQHEEISRGITEPPEVVITKINTVLAKYEEAETKKSTLEEKCKAAEKISGQAQNETRRKLAERDKARQEMNDAEKKQRDITAEIMSLRAKTTAAVLQEQRKILQPGQPCPLCGSREHPAVSHAIISSTSANEFFRRGEELEKILEKINLAVEKAKKYYDETDTKYNAAVIKENQAIKECESLKKDFHEKSIERDSLHAQVREIIAPFRMTGIRKTDDIKKYLQAWAEKIKSIEDEIKRAEKSRDERAAKIDVLKRNLESEREKFSRLIENLSELEKIFLQALAEKNFPDEITFKNSQRSPEIITRLQEERRRLDARQSELEGARANIKSNLEEKQALNITTLSLDETEKFFDEQKRKLENFNGNIARLAQKISDIDALKKRIDELTKQRDKQKEISILWSELSDLIGSAEGDRYRVFVQKITLELVINNANEYLKKMNGRYELRSKPDNNNLELSVIDKDQAGEIRPTENLSGGERFIISLALALGLSQISGSRARVDSLFLDEGFGSLDEDALSTALEALGEVRREGRMIGIISHVGALKERIATQIKVIPKREGVSEIKGPGCSGGR